MPVFKNYNKAFFKTWSREMAYVMGFLYADGNIIKTKRDTHYIAFYTADESLLQLIKTTCKSEHVLAKRSSATGEVFRLQVGSKTWFGDLCILGLTPNKAKRMVLPDIPGKYFADFVRGYFDGDGNVWVGYVHKDRPTSTLTIQTTFTSGSYDFLESLRNKLRQRGVSGGSLFHLKTGNYARLTFSKVDSLKIFRIMYNAPHKLHLERKKVVFEEFVKDCDSKRNL